MKTVFFLIAVTFLTATSAHATCSNVYDYSQKKYVYACDNSSSANSGSHANSNAQRCGNFYDYQAKKYIYACR